MKVKLLLMSAILLNCGLSFAKPGNEARDRKPEHNALLSQEVIPVIIPPQPHWHVPYFKLASAAVGVGMTMLTLQYIHGIVERDIYKLDKVVLTGLTINFTAPFIYSFLNYALR